MPSARAVRCTIKLGNERNPRFVLNLHKILPPLWPQKVCEQRGGRKVGTTSNQHGPYIQGDTHDTMAGTEGCEAARRSQSHKTGPSSDCRLQLACMKSDLLVNAHQPRRVEYVLGSCTHRPSHHESWQCPKAPVWGTKAGSMIRVKS